ncbi:MAG: hypothetical protein HY782_07620 [Chloroflexi bacterium]|nr:hypothetical protein [Chloroflexota bacterium]
MTRPIPISFVSLISLISLLACSAPPPAPRYKIPISANGLYRITATTFQAAGIDLAKVDAATLQLFRGDTEIAVRVQGEGNNLALDFYGQASDSPYSAFTVYWLRWGVEKGKRMRETNSESRISNLQLPITGLQDTIQLEHPVLYNAQAGPPGQPWFWQSLTAPMTTTITATLPAAIPAPAQLSVNLWGLTQHAANPDHHLRVFFNDTRVADESWDGQGTRVIQAALPPAAVRAGENTVRLVAPGDTKAAADIVLLTSIQITYTRRLAAQRDTLEFQGGRGTYRVQEFSGDAVEVFDISEPREPGRVLNTNAGARTVTFASDSETPRRWLAVANTGIRAVPRLVAMQTANLRERVRGSDYVIITHPDFVDALQPLVKWRGERGLKPVVVTTSEIYDEFNAGAESPLALRAFLDSMKPAPRFVLLVGKASYDYRDYLNGPNKNLVPTFLVDTKHLKQAASDNWFVATSASDIHPQSAIGRIPAKTPEQVTRVVDKIIAYESGSRKDDWRSRAIFIADDKEPTFAAMSDALAAKLPARLSSQKVYLAARGGDVSQTRADLVSRWNAGALLLTYIGHGSVKTWAMGPLFSTDDLGAIKNGERLPILFTPTCLDGFFYHPVDDSLAEELLFKNDGGIIAGVVPTGLSVPEAQEELMDLLFAELFDNAAPTLGQALMRAKQQLKADSPEAREIVETFGLLGDPALWIGDWRTTVMKL